MADAARLAQLIIKRLQGTITPWEEVELDVWINSSPENKAFVEDDLRTEELAEDLLIQAEMDEEILDSVVWRSIEKALAKENNTPALQPSPQPRRQTKLLLIGALAAAAILLFLFIRNTPGQAQPKFSSSRSDIWQSQSATLAKPVNGPILTISKDHVLGLDTAKEGSMASLGNWLILKMGSQHIAYILSNKTPDAGFIPDSLYNSISLPPGETAAWQITLPDGSGVFLDPGSSLSFSIHPSGKKTPQRMVALNGSAFFQVAHDPQSPFILETNKDEITVHGTSFSIKDYHEDAASVILQYSGTLQVNNGKGSAILDSAQQATIDPALANITVQKNVPLPVRPIVPLEHFDFSRQNLTSALHEVAQYYRIANVHVAPDLDTLTLGKLRMGKIPKNLPLNELLHALQEDNMHFTATEEAITVTR